MHAASCRKDYLFQLKSEKQYASCTDTSVADTELKKKKKIDDIRN